jgi:hypothetical protein
VSLPDPGLPDQIAPQEAPVNSASMVLLHDQGHEPDRKEEPMSPRHHGHHTTISHPGGDVNRPGFNPPQHHTHVQQVAPGIPVNRRGER